jgi:hypothetical protein
VETKIALKAGKWDSRGDQSLTHLFPAFWNEEFAAPGEEEQQPNRQARYKSAQPLPSRQFTQKDRHLAHLILLTRSANYPDGAGLKRR